MDVMNNEKWIYKSIWQSDKKYTAALDMMLCPEPLVLVFLFDFLHWTKINIVFHINHIL